MSYFKARIQMAYMASAARGFSSAAGGMADQLSQSQASDVAENFVNILFLPLQKSAANSYSFELLSKRKLERKGLVTSFQKLAKLSAGQLSGNSLLSSHPLSTEHAAVLQKRLDSGK